MVEIRKVTGGDEKNLAYIQTESWKAAFRSIRRKTTTRYAGEPEKVLLMRRKKEPPVIE